MCTIKVNEISGASLVEVVEDRLSVDGQISNNRFIDVKLKSTKATITINRDYIISLYD